MCLGTKRSVVMGHEFDEYAASYQQILDRSVDLFGESSDYFADYKVRDLRSVLIKRGASPEGKLRILDFGCGVGASTPYFRKHFPNALLFGADVSEISIEIAKKRYGKQGKFAKVNDANFTNNFHSFDAVAAFCVFHHISHKEHVEWLSKIKKLLKRDGVLVIYEHNPLNFLTVRTVNKCPLDANATLVNAAKLVKRCQESGFKNVGVRYRLFFPRALRCLRPIERFLTRFPLGAQYYVFCTD
jgi:SAM-dependent methyltransferase